MLIKLIFQPVKCLSNPKYLLVLNPRDVGPWNAWRQQEKKNQQGNILFAHLLAHFLAVQNDSFKGGFWSVKKTCHWSSLTSLCASFYHFFCLFVRFFRFYFILFLNASFFQGLRGPHLNPSSYHSFGTYCKSSTELMISERFSNLSTVKW